MRKHWYFIYIDYCDVGGHAEEYRERRYTRRPKRWKNRHKISHIGACYGCRYTMFG